jgi:hypothetical protein
LLDALVRGAARHVTIATICGTLLTMIDHVTGAGWAIGSW